MNEFALNGATKSRNLKDRKLPFQDEKNRQALDDFKKFCNFILDYEANEEAKRGVGNSKDKPPNSPSSFSGSSTSSAADSLNEDVKMPMKRKYVKHKNPENNEEYESDDESWSLVTCFCRKPFAGRPMIECSACNIWIHLSCAKVRRSNIPDLFICPKCRAEKPNQTRTIANGFEDNNTFKSIKQFKSKTKRGSSLSENKGSSRNPKEKRLDTV